MIILMIVFSVPAHDVLRVVNLEWEFYALDLLDAVSQIENNVEEMSDVVGADLTLAKITSVRLVEPP